jgi:hypothetical protein
VLLDVVCGVADILPKGQRQMNTGKRTLWFVRESPKARLYTKVPPDRYPTEEDEIWVPRSIVEHTSKMANGMHIVTLPNWFIEKNGL